MQPYVLSRHGLALRVALAIGLPGACGSPADPTAVSAGDAARDADAGGSTDPEVASDPEADASDPEAQDGSDADVAPAGAPVYAESFRMVRVDASVSIQSQLAVHACAGLYNRREGGSVFVQSDDDVPAAAIDGAIVRDDLWLDALELTPRATIGAIEFLDECITEFGCVRYAYGTQHEILPSILTAAAAVGAPPIAVEDGVACPAPVVDATALFAGADTQIAAARVAYERYLDRTTGLAMLNPGYDRFAPDLANPSLTEDMQVALIDLVFSRQLFVVFLINGCVDGHPEEELLARIVGEAAWERPVGVFGYNDSWLVGGYVYEAQTRCLPSADMGAIPTRTSNLSFFDTRAPAITDAAELAHNPPQVVRYDAAKTYVAFVIGDGDNIRYIMSTRRDWLEQRLARCRGAEPACPPLTWTISPRLPDLAPDVLRWYYDAASQTGADYFMLPPSGAQYAYPGMMPGEVQARFAAETEAAARVLATHSVVHWEWFQFWRSSVDGFLPRYARRDGQIRGVFPVNVPYLVEAFPWWPASDRYQVLAGADGGQVALFRSQSWRGVNDSDDFHPSPQRMADRLAALPPGTVTWVYMTSDGGLTLDNAYTALTELLPDRVQLVSADAAAELALEAGAGGR